MKMTVGMWCIWSLVLCVSVSVAELPKRIPLNEVQVGGEIGRRLDVTIENNIMQLDYDNDFLQPFRDKEKSSGYIGLGKQIDSMVRFAAFNKNPELIKRKEYVIAETIKTQEADGYIGMFKPENRMWSLWDIHEMTYIVNGLISDYRFFDKQASLDSAQKLMDYIITHWEANPDGMKDCSITVFMAVTGLEETLLMLYDTTQDKRYLDFCTKFRKLPEWNYPHDFGRWWPIGGHAYAYFHRCLSQLRLYQLQPDPTLLSQTEKTMRLLLEGDGLVLNGVCSQHECWHNTQDVTEGLGETCSTAYLIRVLDELIRMRQDSIYGDMMERAIINGLFSAQSPDGRKIRYYVPLEGKRSYYKDDTYCCPCNYRRIVAELPGMIYYRIKGGVMVNLYTPSTTTFPLESGTMLTINQRTNYPNNGKITIDVSPEKPVEFPVILRLPRWCEEAKISVRSSEGFTSTGSLTLGQGGILHTLQRLWKKGDVIKLEMPMTWRMVRGRQAQAGRVAIMRGPQIFCLNPELNPALIDSDGNVLDLRQIVIDPETLEGPFPDDTVRPDGMACRVKGWVNNGFRADGKHQITLTLTETADPGSQQTYFKVKKFNEVGVEDELVGVHISLTD